ncbi:MAG: 5-oxoprolinase subunit PxpB [Burkholderiales bacterium]
MFFKPQFFPMGDRALVVELGHRIDVDLSCEIAALARRLRACALPGVTDIVPAYTTLTLHYDPALIGAEPYDAMVAAVAGHLLLENDEPRSAGRYVEIPVCYGGRYGQDLESLSASIGLGMKEVIRIHSEARYQVHMLGFVPGFAYLGGLDTRIAVPRHATPRARVPAGSVAIGGEQTGVYPLATPGGWQLIGRTTVKLFDPDSATPCLLDAGDTVQFIPISEAQFEADGGS